MCHGLYDKATYSFHFMKYACANVRTSEPVERADFVLLIHTFSSCADSASFCLLWPS